ncbi:MAG: glycine betaine ABC transporter substrate-binding protein [Desulfobacteraceae bacterium]|nr:glycine betaine ABC transporter substrate-binding protein [Desulfobacteraceae bacterium]
MMTLRKLFTWILTGFFTAMCLAGGVFAETKKAEIAYVEWSSATAASHMVKAVLQEKMDYDCTLRSVTAPVLWQATAGGNVDGFVCAWLPSLHRDYYAKAGENVVDLGPNLEGTKVGLVVPDYVTIDSIGQINENAEKFNGRIIGIDPGAGIMSATKDAIKIYKLDNMKLSAGSGAMMTSILGDKIDKKQWVVVTGWTPHWKFAKWDLKYLKDPRKIFDGSEAIHTVVRANLEKDKPELANFLDNFYWETGDINEVMALIQKSGEPYKSAVKWINENPEKVDSWLPGE